MKLVKKILTLFILLLGFAVCKAQQIDFKALLKDKDELPLLLLNGIIDKNQALLRSEYIHAKLKNGPYHAASFEKELVDGVVYFYSNEPELAIKVLKTGIYKIPQKNDTLTFKYQASLAEILRETEDYEQAEIYFSKNYFLAKSNQIIEAKIPKELIAFYTTYLKYIKKHGSAVPQIEILDKAYQLSQNLNNKDYLGIVEANYADFYKSKNDYPKAKVYLEKSLKSTQKAYYKLPRLLSLIELQLANNEKKDAAKNLKNCEKLLSELNTQVEEIQYHKLRMAVLWQKIVPNKKQLDLAVKQYISLTNNTKAIYLSKAYLLLGNNEDHSELNYLVQALLSTVKSNNLKDLDAESVLFPNQFLTAALEYSRKIPIKESNEFILNIANVALKLQKSFLFEDQKLDFNQMNIKLIRDGLQKTNEVKDVYQFLELANARVLNDIVLDKKNKLKTIPPALNKKEKELIKSINDWKLNNKKGNEKLIADAQMELGFLRKSMEKQNPNYYNLKYGNNILDLSKVKSQLNDHSAILNYFIDQQQLLVLLIKKNETQVIRHVLSNDFQADFAAFVKNLYVNPGISIYGNQALRKRMYNELFLPIEKHLRGIKNITIIRNGMLNLLPFEVLEHSPNAFLLDRFTFSYDYTVSSKFGFHQATDFNEKQAKPLAFAPFIGSNASSVSGFRQNELGNLQYSEEEVSGISGTIYKNQSATKNNFLENYRNHNVIHFATHAQIDDNDPSKSFIAFYPDQSGYKLYTSDLYALDLSHTQLVILSACEAGAGKLMAGEGLMSLARGFAYSGCKSVITTLWRAHDQSSAWIAARLHSYLEKGYDKDEAMQKAKQDFRQSELGKKYEHPYYWANFIVIGNTNAFELSFWNQYKGLIYNALVIFILVLIFIFYSKRLKKKPSFNFH